MQTEDKGLSAKKIISLVYDGGTILASKRTPYDDLVGGGLDETVLAERVQKQHQLICAAIKGGRIADLKKMTAKAAAVTAEAVAEAALMSPAVSPPGLAAVVAGGELYDRAIPSPFPSPEIIADVPIELAPDAIIERPKDTFTDGPVIDGVSIIEDDDVLPAEAVAVVVSELSGQERLANSKLGIELIGDVKFKGGDRMTVNLMVCRGTQRKVVPDAQIMVKALGSSFRPVIFHAKSDANGLAKIHLQLPHFQAGRAALLIRAMDHGEEIELRRIVTPG